MNLWIVTVNFGNTAPTKSLIDSLSNLDNLDLIKLTVCIADNAASERSSSQLKQILNKSKLDMKIFSYKKNHYYWPAAKKIIEDSRKKLDRDIENKKRKFLDESASLFLFLTISSFL